MFCTKCGNNNPDGVAFCTSCGTPLGAPKAPESSGSSLSGKLPPQVNDFINKMKNGNSGLYKMIGIGAAALIVVIVVVSLIVSNTGINGTIKDFGSGLKKMNSEKVEKTMYTKEYINAKIEDEYDGDKDEYKEDLENDSKETKELFEESDIKIKSIKKEGRAKAPTKKTLAAYSFENKKDAINSIEEEYDIDVKNVKQCKVKIKWKADGETEKDTATVLMYKAKGGWYIYEDSAVNVLTPIVYSSMSSLFPLNQE